MFNSYLSAYSVEVCTAEFTDADSLLKHVWTCDLRSKFMDRDSEQFVCLECGKCCKLEKCAYNHVQKHQQVWFFQCYALIMADKHFLLIWEIVVSSHTVLSALAKPCISCHG